MPDGLQLSARSVASLLAHVFGPSYYDGPRFGRGDPGPHGALGVAAGPQPEPWSAVALNPQPLPPRERYALALADAHIDGLLTLDRAAWLGREVADRSLERGLRIVADIDELCPKWPPWPRLWPPPPPPPWERQEMTPTELFLFGARLLAASELVEHGRLQHALARLGERALDLGTRGNAGPTAQSAQYHAPSGAAAPA